MEREAFQRHTRMPYRQSCVPFSARPDQALYWDNKFHSKRIAVQEQPRAKQPPFSPLSPDLAVGAYLRVLTTPQSQPLLAKRIFSVASTAERSGCLPQLLDGLHACLVSSGGGVWSAAGWCALLGCQG